MAYNKGLNQIDKDRINQGVKDLAAQGKSKDEILAWRNSQVQAAQASADAGKPTPAAGSDAPAVSGASASEDGSLASPKTLSEFGQVAGVKKPRVDDDGEVINLAQDFGDLGAMVESIPFIGDVIDDMYGAVKSGYAQGQTVPDALSVFTQGADVDEETLSEYIAAVNKQSQYAPSKEMLDFNETYEAAGGGAWGFIKAIAQNPSVAATTAISSMVAMINPASAAGAALVGGTGAAAGSAFAGVGAIPGAIGGAFAGAGGMLETGASFTEFLQEELAERGLNFDEEGISKVLQDEDALFSIRARSAARGGIIAIVDGLTAGVASKAAKGVANTAKTASKLKGTLAATAIEGAGGGIGEAAARTAVGQELDAREIGLEIVGEFGTGVALGKAAVETQPSYKINGQRVSANEVNKVLDKDPAFASTIEIKNDPQLKKKVNEVVTEVSDVNENSDIITESESQERSGVIGEIRDLITERNKYKGNILKKKNKPLYDSYDAIIKDKKGELKEIVTKQNKVYKHLTEDDKNILLDNNNNIKSFNEAISNIQDEYGDNIPSAKQNEIKLFQEKIEAYQNENDEVRAQAVALAQESDAKAEAAKAEKEAAVQEEALAEEAEVAGVDPAQLAAQREQEQEIINENVQDNDKVIKNLSKQAIAAGVKVVPEEGTIGDDFADQYIPLGKKGDSFTKGDFVKKLETVQPMDRLTAEQTVFDIQDTLDEKGIDSTINIEPAGEGLFNITGEIKAPKRDKPVSVEVAEQAPTQEEAVAETETEGPAELAPEDLGARAQEIATEKGKKYTYEGAVESTPEGNLSYPGVYATREQAEAFGQPYDTAATGVIKRTQRRLQKAGYPDATYEVGEGGTTIVPGPFNPEAATDEFSIGKSEGQLRLQQQAAKVGSGPQKSKKQYTRKKKHKGRRDEFSLAEEAPENTVQHQDLSKVAGERVQMNIGLENNPLAYDQIISKLQSNPKVRLGTTEQVTGEYDGQPERTLVVDAKFDGKAKDFRDYVKGLADDLTQNSIAVKYNGRGALVEKPGYKEEYTFSDEFFKQPSTLTAQKKTGRAGALDAQDLAKEGITPLVELGEGQSYIKIPLHQQAGQGAELAGGKGGFGSQGDAREAVGKNESGKATQTAADFQAMLQDAAVQAPATLNEDEKTRALESIRKIAKLKATVDTGKKTRPKDLQGKSIPGQFTEAAQVSHPLGNISYGILNNITKSIQNGEPLPQKTLEEVNKAYDQLMGYEGAHQNLNNKFRIGVSNTLNLPLKKEKATVTGGQQIRPQQLLAATTPTNFKGQYGRPVSVVDYIQADKELDPNIVLGKDVKRSRAKSKKEGGKEFPSSFDRTDVGESASPRQDIRGKGIKGTKESSLYEQADDVMEQYNDGQLSDNDIVEKFGDYVINQVPKIVTANEGGRKISQGQAQFEGVQASEGTRGYTRENKELEGFAIQQLANEAAAGKFQGLSGKKALAKAKAIAKSARTRQRETLGTSRDAQRVDSVVRRGEQAFFAENGYEPSIDELSDYINTSTNPNGNRKYNIDVTPEAVEASKFKEETFGSVSELQGVVGEERDRAQAQIAREAGLDQLTDAVLTPSQRTRVDNAIAKIIGERPEIASEGKFTGQKPRRGAGFQTKGDVAAKRVKEANTRLDKFANEGVQEMLTTGVLRESFRELASVFGYPEGQTFDALSKNEKRDLKRKVARGIVNEAENRAFQAQVDQDEFSFDTNRNPNRLPGKVQDLHGKKYRDAADDVAFYLEDNEAALQDPKKFQEFSVGKNPDKFLEIKKDIEDYYPGFYVHKHPNGSGEMILTKNPNPFDLILDQERGRVGDVDIRDFTQGAPSRNDQYQGFDVDAFKDYLNKLKPRLNDNSFATVQRITEGDRFSKKDLLAAKNAISEAGLRGVETNFRGNPVITINKGKPKRKRVAEFSIGNSKENVAKAVEHLQELNPGTKFITDKKKIEEVVERSGHPKSLADRVRGVFTRDGEVVLNMDNIGMDVPFHEVGHGWLKRVANDNPEFYAKGEALARQSETYKRLKKDPVYGKYPDHRLIEEVMATDIGEKGSQIFNDKRNATRWDNWVKKAKQFVAKAIGMNYNEFEKMTYGDFIEGAAADIATGEKVLDYGRLAAQDEFSFSGLESDIKSFQNKAYWLSPKFERLEGNDRDALEQIRLMRFYSNPANFDISKIKKHINGFKEHVDRYYDDWHLNKDIESIEEAFSKMEKSYDDYVNASLMDEYSLAAEPYTLDSEISDLQAQAIDSENKWYKPSGWIRKLIPPAADDYHGLISKITSIVPAKESQKVTDAYVEADHAYKERSSQIRKEVADLINSLPFGLDKAFGTIGGVKINNAQAIQSIVNGVADSKRISSKEKAALEKLANNPKVKDYINNMKDMGILKEGTPVKGANPTADLLDYISNTLQKEYFADFVKERDAVFTPEKMDQIKRENGEKFHEALQDSLSRMKSGKTGDRPSGRFSRGWHDFLQGSIGVTMFLNFRSAALQMLSVGNYALNSNSPLEVLKNIATGASNAEQREIFKKLWNSGYLKERRARAGFDVNASEMITEMKKGKFADFQKKLLNKGFAATSVVDSIAIAWGGAAYMRANGGMTKANLKAWKEMTEESQQSSRPDRVSQYQTSGPAKFILAFANTPAQYFRLSQKAFREIKKGKNVKQNLAKLTYYAAIQNAIFTAAQSASTALLYGLSGDDEQDKEALAAYNSMIGSYLRGMGLVGASFDAAKNVIMEAVRQEGKARPDHVATALKAISISPPLSRKINDLISIGRAHNYKQEDKWITTASRAGSFANLPTDWIQKKGQAAAELFDDEYTKWQSLWMLLGWSKYQFEPQKEDSPFSKVNFGGKKFGGKKFDSKKKF